MAKKRSPKKKDKPKGGPPGRDRDSAPARGSSRGLGTGRTDLLWAAALSLVAFFHRLFFLRSNRDKDWPFTIFYEGDSEAFFRFARAVLEGRTYDEGLPYHPPGFAYVLANIHDLLGADPGVAVVPHFEVKVFLAVISSLSVGLLYLLVRPYLGRTAAIFSALLAAYSFGLYVIAVAPVTEGVYLTLFLAAWLLFSRSLPHPLTAPGGEPRRPLGSAILLGGLCGVLALTRAEAMLLPFIFSGLGLLGLWLDRRHRDVRAVEAWAPWLWVPVVCAVTIFPWTLHNHRQLEALNHELGSKIVEPLPTWVPVTIYGPINLALANNSIADGTFSRDAMPSQRLQGNLDLEDPQHLEFLLHGDRIARRWILEHPDAFAALVGKKWELVSRVTTLGFTQWNWPGGLDGLRRPVDVFTPHDTILRWFLLPLVLVGMVVCAFAGPETRRWLALAGAACLVGIVSTTAFFGYVRQGLLMLPFAFTFVGAAVAFAVGRGRDGLGPGTAPGRSVLLAVVALAAVLLVVEWSGSDDDRNYRASGSTIPGSHKLNRDQPITLELLPAEGASEPDPGGDGR